MTHAKSRNLKKSVYAMNAPDPYKYGGPNTLRSHSHVMPRVPPCVVGKAAGIQETRSSTKIASNLIAEGKTHASKFFPASLGNENYSSGMFKTLQKENLQLTDCLKEKDSIITKLMRIIEEQATKYNTAIALEKEHQKETERRLEESENLIKDQIQLLDETIRHYTKIIQEQYTQHAELVSEMKKQNEADIKCREEKIAKLKEYISETFQEKSREHQQQIDELMREISKFTQKSQILKT
ncbi:uncharacterized protein LOC100556345 [Anolis carolinensis]|uniref:uncharacterized protein LOC100556345 n=1 Tax=Anolis carolinensis TaxID=28377 RepID=UPI000203AFF5|nr:PREDICTED: uncharacterized protein LOC100556345 [Anolis carolinensis]XP_008119300.1 PREDICTED: uncharacterized protein LOC100556345 [Anolis carolinensis]|eukprot:XP_003227814.1 PREDICTED: uncharacterized protein LOC100556345 [Anolis carolinensis]